MDGSFSSQYFTSLMLIAPVLEQGIKIIVKGEQVSKSYIDMTVDGLESFGVKVTNNKYEEYIIAPGSHYKPTNYHIEGDCSGAAYFWSIAALNGGHIRVHNINPSSAQGDVHFPDLLEKMGCAVSKNQDEKWIEVIGATDLKGLSEMVDMESMPDTAQPLAVAASLAKGITHLGGLSTLRIKETDRIAAMNIELAKCGVKTEIGPDRIKIIPGQPTGAVIDTYKDHRMAMSFALLGTKVGGIVVNEPNVVSKSFPEFWDLLNQIGVEIEK
jgi:3-phosphoshikimate 1-carboxyvinyltransferase